VNVNSELSESPTAASGRSSLVGRLTMLLNSALARPAFPLALFVVVAALPFYTGDSLLWTRQVELVAITAIVVVGLNLSYGYAGELALGQAAMYAAGAYVTALLALHGYNDLLIVLPASAAAAAVIGLLTGIPGLRLSGFALAMISFFLILLVPDIVSLKPQITGGYAGLAAIPNVAIAGVQLSNTGYYLMVVIVGGAIFAIFRNILVSRTGIALRVLRQSPVLASSLGISVLRVKLLAYILGAIPAGIAGCLFAYLDNYISPSSFTFSISVSFLAASILGGSQSVYGAFVGAALIQLASSQLTGFQQYSLIAYGIFLLFAGLAFSAGLSGLSKSIIKRLREHWSIFESESDSAGSGSLGTFEGVPLQVSGVTKRFGGVSALTSVSLRAEPGQVTAIIGANGSGKTTLLNLISGFYRADSGSLRLASDELSGLGAAAIAMKGVARTFQTPSIPKGLSAAEVVAAARYTRARAGLVATIFRLRKYTKAAREDRDVALRLMGLFGIAHLASSEAASLPLGTRRLLEVARALAAWPSVLLLDEPASGLDHGDIAELAGAIRRVRDADATIVLVEHNFPLVLEIADRVHVLERGQLLASGTPAEIRENALVIQSYLGPPVGENI
jgi:branched-chain amino acid transport system permease protein